MCFCSSYVMQRVCSFNFIHSTHSTAITSKTNCSVWIAWTCGRIVVLLHTLCNLLRRSPRLLELSLLNVIRSAKLSMFQRIEKSTDIIGGGHPI